MNLLPFRHKSISKVVSGFQVMDPDGSHSSFFFFIAILQCDKSPTKSHISKANTDVFRKTHCWNCCQSSSHHVLIQGSSFKHRQIILQLMVVLSCRLTMGYHSSCVSIQMWTRTYTNARSVSHLGSVAGDLGTKRKRRGVCKTEVQVRKTEFITHLKRVYM